MLCERVLVLVNIDVGDKSILSTPEMRIFMQMKKEIVSQEYCDIQWLVMIQMT